MHPSFFARHRRALLGAGAALAVFGGVFFAAPQAGLPFGTPAAIAQQRAPEARHPGFADMVERVRPAVVAVQVSRGGEERTAQRRDDINPNDPLWRFFRDRRGQGDEGEDEQGAPRGGQPRPALSQGSGFFVSADGFIVTNHHVVRNGNRFTVIMDDGTRLEARLVGADPRTDIAVLRAERQQPFPFVEFSGANPPRVGDWVVAIGNPFGLGGTVTAGIVSARGRDIGSGPYDDFIQIDAPVNRGNSGGPTFDQDGRVIGINTAIYSPSGGSVGIGFAIPASIAAPIVAQIRETGSVTRGFLGVMVQPITEEIGRSLGLQQAQGAIVADTPVRDSPAARAGLRAGDAIITVNGEAIRDARDLTRRVAALRPGQAANFEILRGGQRQTVAVEIGRLGDDRRAEQRRPGQGERDDEGTESGKPNQQRGDGGQQPPPRQQTAMIAGLGVSVLPGREGVTVGRVDPNGPAAQRGIRSGDIILDVGGEPVARPEDVTARLDAARQQGRNSILLRVRSGDRSRFVAIPVQQG